MFNAQKKAVNETRLNNIYYSSGRSEIRRRGPHSWDPQPISSPSSADPIQSHTAATD